MAKKTRYIFGLQVKKETTDGTYDAPSDALCLQGDSDMGEATYRTNECNPMSDHKGTAYQVVMDGDNPSATIPIKQPLTIDLGALEHIILCAGLKKTTLTSPDRDAYTPDSSTENGLSSLLTEKRRSWKGKGGRVDFSISANVNDWVNLEATISTSRFELSELDEADADNSIPSVAVNGATGTLYFNSNHPVLINGESARVKSFKFGLGNTVSNVENDTDGKIYFIEKFAPTLELTADMASDLKFKSSDVKSATEFNVVIPLCDNTGAVKYNLNLPKSVLQGDPKITNNGGLQEGAVTYSCKETNGDDNFSLEKLL